MCTTYCYTFKYYICNSVVHSPSSILFIKWPDYFCLVMCLSSESTTKQICPYAIHVFDLRTDRRIRKYQLRPEDIQPGTFITNIAIDVGKSCEDTFLYASDQLAYGLLSYSWERNTSWRARHGFFFPDPLLGKSSSTRLSVNFRILL